MCVIRIGGNSSEILNQLFGEDADGRLIFGPTGISIAPSSRAALKEQYVEFRDYIMEGFVRYRLKAVEKSAGLELHVELLGTYRDDSVPWFVARWCEHAGFSVEREKAV